MAKKQNCPWCKAKPGGCAKCQYTGKIEVNTYPKGKKGHPWPPGPEKK